MVLPLFHTFSFFYLIVFVRANVTFAQDSFLRMNSIASVLYSPYAIWFPLYIAVAYAGLPLLVAAC